MRRGTVLNPHGLGTVTIAAAALAITPPPPAPKLRPYGLAAHPENGGFCDNTPVGGRGYLNRGKRAQEVRRAQSRMSETRSSFNRSFARQLRARLPPEIASHLAEHL